MEDNCRKVVGVMSSHTWSCLVGRGGEEEKGDGEGGVEVKGE